MAFNPARLNLVLEPVGGEGLRWFNYKTDDSEDTLTAAGYFEDAEKRGLRLYDLVFVSPEDGSAEPYILNIDSIAGSGHATAVNGSRGAVPDMLTAERLLGIRVPASVDAVTIVGNEEAGDDGEPVTLYRDPSATVGYVADAAATKFAYNSRTVTLSKMLWGYDHSDTSGLANYNALVDALVYIKAKGGGEIILPGEEFVFGSGSLTNNGYTAIMPYDFAIIGKPGNLIKAKTGHRLNLFGFMARNVYYQTTAPTTPLTANDIWFDEAVTSTTLGTGHTWNGSAWVEDLSLDWNSIYYPATLETHNLNFDVTGGVDTSGQDASPLAALYYRRHIAHDNYVYAGANYAANHGDTLISTVGVYEGDYQNNSGQGLTDGVYYLNRDNKKRPADMVGDGAFCNIRGGGGYRCQGFQTSKRELDTVRISGVKVIECGFAFGSGEVTAGLAQMGRNLYVEDSEFIRVNRPGYIRGHTKGKLTNNRFVDWAYDTVNFDGTSDAALPCVDFSGASDWTVIGNSFELIELADNTSIGLRIQNQTIGGEAFTAGNIYGSGNKYRGMGRAIYEINNGGLPNASRFVDEFLVTPAGTSPAVWFQFVNTLTTASYRKDDEPYTRHRLGTTGVARVGVPIPLVCTTATTLTTNDIDRLITNQGATALVEVTLPTAEAGVQFNFHCADTDGLRIRAGTGDTITNGASTSTAAGYIETTQIGASVRLECNDTVRWIVRGMGGTWTFA